MKKIILLVLVALSVVMCSAKKADTAGTESQAKAEQVMPTKIVVGLDDTFAPMGFKDDKGEIVGFDIDLAKAVGQKLGIPVEFKSINWDSKVIDLNNKNIDVIWNGLTITEERKKEVLFTNPYLQNSQVVVTKAGSTIVTKADLKGKVVAAQSQSSGEEAFKKDPISKEVKELKTFDQYDQAFLDLEAGRVDAIIVDEIMARYIQKTKETQAKKALYAILTEDFGKEDYGIGARKTDTLLVEKINAALEELKKDGTFDKIYKQWFAK